MILFGALILMLPISSVQGIITPFHKALFTFNFCSMCDRACSRGYWKLLVCFWTDSDHVSDTDRRSGSYNNSNSRIYIIRKKNIDYAAKHDAKCDLCTKSRRDRSIDEFYLKGTLLIELIGDVIHDACFCHDFGLRGIWMSIFHSVSAFCNAGFRSSWNKMASICIIDIICGKSSDQHCDHVTDHHWWNWIFYMGRHLSP